MALNLWLMFVHTSSLQFSERQAIIHKCLILKSAGHFLGDTDHRMTSIRNGSTSQTKVFVDLENKGTTLQSEVAL